MTNPEINQAQTDLVRQALADIVQSDGFSGSPRIIAFLTYVVSEALDGRSASIKARTIAQDVYDRDTDDDQQINLVRVDAGRLRRLLNDYYATLSATPRVRIDVPKGTYVPRFTFSESSASGPPSRVESGSKDWRLRAALGVAAVLCMIALAALYKPTANPDSASLAEAERSATFEVSPERLQAASIVEDARFLMFPAFDPIRLSASKDLFARAALLDPLSGDALAGVGVATSMTAFLSPPSEARSLLADKGRETSHEAVELAPSSGWAHICLAWSLFVSGDTEGAMRQADIATGLSPKDATIQDYQALIYLFSGSFDRAVQLSDPDLDGLPYTDRTPRINILGGAHFHLGAYPRSIQAFQKSAATGAPVSPLATAYLVAALHANGDIRQARDLAQSLNEGWPDADVRALARLLFSPDVDLQEFRSHLDSAGVLRRSEQ